jgi:MerR family transcriptional regulator, light-induced transcriptional regulator
MGRFVTDEQRLGHALRIREPKLAAAAVEEQYRRQPDLAARYGPDGWRYCVRDVARHVDALASSVELGNPSRFVGYVRWARRVMSAHRIAAADLLVSLQSLSDVLSKFLPPEAADAARDHLHAALATWNEPEPSEG